MKLPLIAMFSGQGSQYYQMGRGLFATNKTFKSWMLKADSICHDLIGESIIDHLYNETNKASQPFTKTTLTHPAIFMVEHALLQVLYDNDIYPNVVLGGSMGEFTSAVAAKALSFETALVAVIHQAKFVDEYCQEAGMLAILADPTIYQEEQQVNQITELAAINFSSHFIVSGTKPNLEAVASYLKTKQIATQLLPISRGFHSTYIDPAAEYFLGYANKLKLIDPSIPSISCVTADKLTRLQPQYFWDIIRCPIQFQKAIEYLEKQQPYLYLDLGPSGTLATFVKYIITPTSQSKFLAMLTPFDQQNRGVEKVLELKHSF